ncbi:hypothetical protein AWB82_07038 [Caballeronia glebae]|uniref:Uncharacterized protein n=1 Tax=Caballeronia glebae TaxID=1777143 RepID=A0A158DPR8_9BURK|nr:hypothetical protein AWB82_07038 [Caballeronia glebae]
MNPRIAREGLTFDDAPSDATCGEREKETSRFLLPSRDDAYSFTPMSSLPTVESDFVMLVRSTFVCVDASTCVTGATLVCGLANEKPPL